MTACALGAAGGRTPPGPTARRDVLRRVSGAALLLAILGLMVWRPA